MLWCEVGGRFLWLSHVDVWQKPTQYCKAIILALKINKFKLNCKKKERKKDCPCHCWLWWGPWANEGDWPLGAENDPNAQPVRKWRPWSSNHKDLNSANDLNKLGSRFISTTSTGKEGSLTDLLLSAVWDLERNWPKSRGWLKKKKHNMRIVS